MQKKSSIIGWAEDSDLHRPATMSLQEFVQYLSAFEGTNQTFLQQLKTYLSEHGRERTTHIALEYLLYASENKFHSHLLELCMVLDKPRGPEFLKALEEMKKMGHTSGADTLVGILVGIKAAVFQ